MPVFYPQLETGRSYRLRRDLEVRDDRTGSMRHFFLKGTELKVKRLVPEWDQVFVEGAAAPIPLTALTRLVDPVE